MMLLHQSQSVRRVRGPLGHQASSLVLKEDAGLALNDKTKILVKDISAADAHAAAQRLFILDPSLSHLSPLFSPASFVVDVYIGLGVPIGTDAFVQHFVNGSTCSTRSVLSDYARHSKSTGRPRPRDDSGGGQRRSRCATPLGSIALVIA
jgi:hypothetical protein